MFKDIQMNRDSWNKKKDSSFKELESLKERILHMHKQIDNKNLDAIQKFLYFNYEDITSSQFRNIYSLILDVKDPSQLVLKRVKLAYIAGRTDKNKKGMLSLLNFMDELFEEVKDDAEKFKGVKTFAESVVAYHKYYESLGRKPQKQ
jgi:CRISPR type III-A-associated protein Csm2